MKDDELLRFKWHRSVLTVTGKTYPVRYDLKKYYFRWHPVNKIWIKECLLEEAIETMAKMKADGLDIRESSQTEWIWLVKTLIPW